VCFSYRGPVSLFCVSVFFGVFPLDCFELSVPGHCANAYIIELSQSSSDILRLRKRFVRHREEESRVYFARRQTRLSQQREVCFCHSLTYLILS